MGVLTRHIRNGYDLVSYVISVSICAYQGPRGVLV